MLTNPRDAFTSETPRDIW